MNRDDTTVTRRRHLIFTGSVGIAGLAGCINPLSSGDSNPEFEVTIQETNAPITTGEVLTVRVRVRNEGDNEARKTVSLGIAEESYSQDVTIPSGGVSDIEFRHRMTDAEGETELLAETEFSADTRTITIQREMFTEYSLSVQSYRDELIDGERFTAQVRVTNQGTAEETHDLQLFFEGFSDPVAVQSLSLGEDDSETVTLDWVTDGAHTSDSIEVRYAGESVERDITVREPSDPQLEVEGGQSQMYPGETYALDVTVTNMGDVSVSGELTFAIDGDQVETQSVSVDGQEPVQETFEYTPAIGVEETINFTVTFGDQSFSDSVTVERAIEQVDSNGQTTHEDFAELVQVTLSNDSSIEQERVVEAQITTEEEETFGGTIGEDPFEITRPADTFTNQRPVTVPPNTEETFYIKIPTGMWRFNAATKFGNDPSEETWVPTFSHEAEVIRDPSADAELNEWEKVAAIEGRWEFLQSAVLVSTTLENVTDESATVTVIGLIENLQGDEIPGTAEREVTLDPEETRNIDLTVDTGSVEFPGFDYVEIAGVRNNPGSPPGIVELT